MGNIVRQVEDFENTIISVAGIIREERKEGRLGSDAISENRLIRLPGHGRAIFVGDIHGELESIDEVLRRTGFANDNLRSKDRGYIIFLGDLVDRGAESVEVLTTVLELKVRFKDNVILLKGNHELPDVNARYGFMDEVTRKYPLAADEIYKLCNRLFEKLPHAVVTANGIFAVHGGVPENVSSLPEVASLEGDQLEQLLWNDPRPQIKGFEPNYGRDPIGLTAIRYFGDDVTANFLEEIGAKVLVRGHEYFDGSGYMAVSKRVLTIFSARYGRSDWRRAYVDTDLSKEIDDVNSIIPDVRVF